MFAHIKKKYNIIVGTLEGYDTCNCLHETIKCSNKTKHLCICFEPYNTKPCLKNYITEVPCLSYIQHDCCCGLNKKCLLHTKNNVLQ
jgi:hypothetical protein